MEKLTIIESHRGYYVLKSKINIYIYLCLFDSETPWYAEHNAHRKSTKRYHSL
jgi:hypothetical protein